MITVNIGIITYNRPESLLCLLKSLDNICVNSFFNVIRIVIVDNSSDFATQSIINQIYNSKFPVLLEHEVKPGIPFARNKVVELSQDVEFIAFIDDDEFADKNWLAELISTQVKYNCDVVQGPVLNKYVEMSGKPTKKSADRPRFVTGTLMKSLATGNVLIRTKLLNLFDGPFEIKFAQTGGTDSLLGRRIYSKGFSIVWCNEAVVYEFVPKNRQTLKWRMQRSLRGGNNYSLQLRTLDSSRITILRRFCVCCIHIILGVFYIPLLFFPSSIQFYSFYKISEGFGGIIGLLGIRYNEYKRKK